MVLAKYFLRGVSFGPCPGHTIEPIEVNRHQYCCLTSGLQEWCIHNHNNSTMRLQLVITAHSHFIPDILYYSDGTKTVSLIGQSIDQRLDRLYVNAVLSQLNAIRNDLSFSAFNLFRVNANTFLSCLAFILTHSVILIQTNWDRLIIFNILE